MSRPVSIVVDATKKLGKYIPINRFFGADEPNYAYYPDGKALLQELGNLRPAQTYFRTHNLLTTGDGTPALKWGSTNVYTEDDHGNPVYDWTIVDRIFDTYLECGIKPYVQIGFMPKALSTHPEPYKFSFTPGSPYNMIYTGWSYPPTDYKKWGELVYRWTKHCVERYGKQEVESWYWEVWNEPNIPYWQGSFDEFLGLHDVAIAAVKRALPTARVGGCETAGGPGKDWLQKFLKHTLRGGNKATGEIGGPLDFISFHAKGAPTFVDGHVRMGIAEILRDVDSAFRVVESFPELKDKPIVIGEMDPDGCAACITPQYGYRNGLLYPSYTVASFVRAIELAERRGVNLEGAVTWAFEFEGQPYFDGLRVLATNQINKPVLNAHRMMAKMIGNRIEAGSDGQVPLDTVLSSGVSGETDVGVMATTDEDRVHVLVWHYHDDDLPKPEADVSLKVAGISGYGSKIRIHHHRVDNEHSNSYTMWLKMGSPQSPSQEQDMKLKESGQLQMIETSKEVEIDRGILEMKLTLPIHGLSLIAVEGCQ